MVEQISELVSLLDQWFTNNSCIFTCPPGLQLAPILMPRCFPLFNLKFTVCKCQRKDEAICSAISFLGVPLSTPPSSTLARTSSHAHLKPGSGKGNGITMVDLSVQDWLCCWEKGPLPLNSKERWTPNEVKLHLTWTTTTKKEIHVGCRIATILFFFNLIFLYDYFCP